MRVSMAHGQVLPPLEYIPVKTKRSKPKHRGSGSSLLHTSFSHSLAVLPAVMPRITSLHSAEQTSNGAAGPLGGGQGIQSLMVQSAHPCSWISQTSWASQVTQVLGASRVAVGLWGKVTLLSSPHTCTSVCPSPPLQQNSCSPPAWPLKAAHPHGRPRPAASPGLLVKINGN